MRNQALQSLITGINAQIKALNETNFKIFDAENPEYFISGIDYSSEDDKLIFQTKEDPQELSRLNNLQK